MAQRTILNANIAAKLLNQDIWTTFTSKQTEEHRHPWQVSQFQRFNRPLFVVWDHSIWTPPGEDGSMRATGDRERLDTRESRMNILANHVNKKIGYPTPIISFTISAIEVQDFAHARLWEKGRGSPIVTVINPNTRLKKGLPTLRLLDEMTAYGVPPPPWKKSEFYKHQYICLWEITKEEIVGHWKWEDLGRHFTWYQHIIMNAFRQHDGITIKTDPMAIFLPRLSREQLNPPPPPVYPMSTIRLPINDSDDGSYDDIQDVYRDFRWMNHSSSWGLGEADALDDFREAKLKRD